MTHESEYTKQADALLAAMNVTFKTVLIGSDCPTFCEDALKGKDMDKVDVYPRKPHIHGKHYRCTFVRTGHDRAMSGMPNTDKCFIVDFWNSYVDEEFNYLNTNRDNPNIPYQAFKKAGINPDRMLSANKRIVRAYDVLACIQKSDPGTFEDFCSDFGYDTDSRRAETTYRAVVDEWSRVKAFFTAAEIEKLQEVN